MRGIVGGRVVMHRGAGGSDSICSVFEVLEIMSLFLKKTGSSDTCWERQLASTMFYLEPATGRYMDIAYLMSCLCINVSFCGECKACR